MKTWINFSLPLLSLVFVSSSLTMSFSARGEDKIRPVVVKRLFQKAMDNTNWKKALVTGKSEQVVLMTVSPATNPANEIGNEVHAFDQVILIASGKAKVVLNGEMTLVGKGDMIFVPQGVNHNVINLDPNKPLKVVSFYSSTDIPANSVFKEKADEQAD